MSKSSESRDLGMDRPIARRDFINGVGVGIGALLVPKALAQPAPDYPPRRTGMRGSHDGSFEVAHSLRNQGQWDLSGAMNTGETYDLIVVGAGMSGLAAAHYFQKNIGRTASVLILDNHDDFGGHAKRNEFHYKRRTLALNGGTLNIESPNFYNAPAKQLLADVGIDLERYEEANAKNRELYQTLGLGNAYFFDKETWGSDRLVVTGARGGGGGAPMSAEFLQKTPLSAKAREDVLRLYDPKQPDY